MVKLMAFPKIRKNFLISPFTTFIQQCTKGSSQCKKKKLKGVQSGKEEVKLSLFADNIEFCLQLNYPSLVGVGFPQRTQKIDILNPLLLGSYLKMYPTQIRRKPRERGERRGS